MWGEDAGRITGVNTGFLDVLHDRPDDDCLSVTDHVDVDFDGGL